MHSVAGKVECNTMEAFNQLVGHLAWPITVLLLAIIFRRQLQKLIERLEKAETKWGDFTFSKAIDDIREDFIRIEGRVTAFESHDETDIPETKELYAPVAEVMSAWTDVEELCKQLLTKKGIHAPRTYRALGSRLNRNQLIDSEHAIILGKLRQVRNIAAHGSPETVSARDAQEYIVLANRMMTYLNRQLGGE